MTASLRHAPAISALAIALTAAVMMGTGAGAQGANVGVAAAVNIDAKGRPPGGGARVITLGQNVVHNEEIATDGTGLVQILLIDGTTFTVGPGSRLVIDEFVYDPNTGDAKVIASVTKGAFRFIGGQTSRKEGGATINTPIGTIGVRGAMLEGNVLSSRSGLFSMIFGDEVRFTGPGGQRAKIFRPGYTLEAQFIGGNLQTNVRPRTQDDASTFLTALAGAPGRSGGAKEKPGDDTVEESGLSEVNSDLPDTAPIPQRRPWAVQSTSIYDVEDTVAEIDIITQQELNQEIIQQQEELATTPARVLTTTGDDAYAIGGAVIERAGERGLVGSTSSSDFNVNLVERGGRLTSLQNGIDLPDLTGPVGDGGLTLVSVVDGASSRGAVSGPAYAGAGDFAAYLLGVGGDASKPFYLITGTPAPTSVIDRMFAGSDVREYALTTDPLRQGAVPYFAQDLFGVFSTYSSSNLYIVESNTDALHSGSSNPDTKVFQSWIVIEGSGVDQKSAVGVMASALDRQTGGFETDRRGSFRYGATAGPANLRGNLSTIGGASGGGKSIFGPNAENFMLGADLNPADAYFDSLLGPGFTGNGKDGYIGDGTFATHHVGGLVQTTSQSSLSRTSRTVAGFMSGVGESSAEGISSPYVLGAAAGSPNFTMELDGRFNTTRAQANVFDVNDNSPVVASYLLTFGPVSGDAGGDSAFVNDSVFGAIQNSNNGNTRLRTDGGQDLANRTGDNPGSYIVSGRANPIAGYQHCTTCDFIDWGWWGTRVQIGASGSEIPNGRSDYVHMGTWVAGDITRPADLPNTIDAAYSGTALGTVVRQSSAGTAKYIAQGDMNMRYNFNSRSGTLEISNFDGMTVSGSMADISTSNQALFAGGLGGTGGVTGFAQGAFVNNHSQKAGGVIGGFSFGNGSGIAAEGTIAGRRTR